MTDFKQFANRIVAQDIGECHEYSSPPYTQYTVAEAIDGEKLLSAEQFCTHPAVVLALMKKCDSVEVRQYIDGSWSIEVLQDCMPFFAYNELIELAIVQACLSALEGKK